MIHEELINMDSDELLEKLKMNIIATDMSMMDAPYFGFSGDKVRGVEFAINKILEGTGITISDLIKESNDKKWFVWKPIK
jgi:hypothetical protein